jgi:hypothetical protein
MRTTITTRLETLFARIIPIKKVVPPQEDPNLPQRRKDRLVIDRILGVLSGSSSL